MNKMPVSSPAPAPRETLHSYLARLAAHWQTDTRELSYDMGAPFMRMLHQDAEVFEAIDDWAKLAPGVMEELLSWTGVKAGDVRIEFRGEVFVSRALRNPTMRGCPVCLREDALHTKGGAAAMIMRGDWQFREVTICVRHGHPLVPLWTAQAPRHRFDIGVRLREIENDITSGALDQECRQPSDYDLWLDKRLQHGKDNTWFRGYALFAVATFLHRLGQSMSRLNDNRGAFPGSFHAAGFDAAVGGPEGLRQTLDQIAATVTGHLDEPNSAFGPLYKCLNHDYSSEVVFEPFRRILRDCILAHWPIGAGEVVLGERIEARRLHSLTTASHESGMGTQVLEHFLIESGALLPEDPRPPNRRLFDAQEHAELLAEIPNLVGPIAMRKAMGATRQELAALRDQGVLLPRTKTEKVKNPWRASDGISLVKELSADSIPVDEADKGWETLLLAFRRRGLPLPELIDAIREKRLRVGQRVGVNGFNGIVVSRKEVDGLVGRPATVRDLAAYEMSGTIAAVEFGRSVGLREAFLELIDAGHVSAQLVENPLTRRSQYRMTHENIDAFHQKFVTLTSLSAEFGQHRNSLKIVIDAAQIPPFSPNGKDFGRIYRREDVVGLMKRHRL
ncbi:MAG: TniQ family protein [Paracoccaceae bacterium]|nr:TniQ family protein [Paracoccaceae bacterium]